MKVIWGRVWEDGKLVRKHIILESKLCENCGISYEPSRSKSRYCSEKCRALSYKDTNRHGGKRKELIEENGLVCSVCGKIGTRKQIHTHHITMDKTEHDYQELRCLSCHSRIHWLTNNPRSKVITKDQVEYVVNNLKKLDDMCKYLGITRSFLYKKRIEYGLPLIRVMDRVLTKEMIEDALSKNKTLGEAAKSLGIDRKDLYEKRKEFGLPKSKGGRKHS
jgi:DNA-binding protein Fis